MGLVIVFLRPLGLRLIEGNLKIAKLRTYSGHTVICRIPIYTPEEERKVAAEYCEAIVEFMNPGVDISQIKYMEVKV